MATAEKSSAGNTFSMSRWAMVMPSVARRSPPMATPSANRTAATVVPCGTSGTAPAPAARSSSSSGAYARSASTNDGLNSFGPSNGFLTPASSRERPRPYSPPFWTYCFTNSSAFSSSTSSISSRRASSSSLSSSPFSVMSGDAWASSCSASCLPVARRFCSAPPPLSLAIVPPWTSVEAIVSSRTPYSQAAPAVCGRGGSALEVADQVLGGGAGVEDGCGVGGGAPGRLEHGDPLEGLAADVEDDRVPAGGGDLGGVAGQAPAAEVGPGVLGGLGHRPGDLLLGDQPLDPAGGGQPVVQALVDAHVVVLEVDQGQLGVLPLQAVAAGDLLHELVLGRPVDGPGRLQGVVLEQGQHGLPALQDLQLPVAGVAVLEVGLGRLQVVPLELAGGQAAAVLALHHRAQGRVLGDRPQGLDRVGQLPLVAGDDPVLDHVEDDGQRPGLEEGGHLVHVGVADDHVQAPVALGVGVGLVAGVDDGALEGRLQPDLDLEELAALGDLEGDRAVVVVADQAARAGEHLAADQERGQVADDPGERGRPVDQEVLVGAVGGALAVGVVLVDLDAAAAGGELGRPPGRLGQDPLPRLVVGDQGAWVEALGR